MVGTHRALGDWIIAIAGAVDHGERDLGGPCEATRAPR